MEIIMNIQREKLIEHYKLKLNINKEFINEEIEKNMYNYVFNEIKEVISQIKQIKMIQSGWKYDEEKKDFEVKFEIYTTFENPLYVLTDINRNYAFFRLQLNNKFVMQGTT